MVEFESQSHIPLSIALFISLNNFEVARLEEKTIAIIYEKKVIFLARSNLICGGCELDRVDVGVGLGCYQVAI